MLSAGLMRIVKLFVVRDVTQPLTTRSSYSTECIPLTRKFDVYGNARSLREEHRLRVFENRVLRRIFGPKRDEVTGE
jgi:hypothetical protein